MGSPAKKIDGRSKEARAARAKAPAKRAAAKTAKATVKRAKAGAGRIRNVEHVPDSVSQAFDKAILLRMSALETARSCFGTPAAKDELLPLARQIEQFLVCDRDIYAEAAKTILGCGPVSDATKFAGDSRWADEEREMHMREAATAPVSESTSKPY